MQQGRAKSTVKREIYALQGVVNKLRFTDNKAWKRLNGHNPFAEADKAKVKGGERRRRRIISPDEEEVSMFKRFGHRGLALHPDGCLPSAGLALAWPFYDCRHVFSWVGF